MARHRILLTLTLFSAFLNCGWSADVATYPDGIAVDGAAADKHQPKQGWDEGWEVGESNWFHHASQGTMILPYDWFMALEQPTLDPEMPPMALFSDSEYLRQFGFIPSVQNDKLNPGALPVGFAISKNWVDPRKPPGSIPTTAVGLTCAACHTGEITYKDQSLRIDGGSAKIDLGKFQKQLATALIITNSSAKKFEAFAERCLKVSPLLAKGSPLLPQYNEQTRAKLKGILKAKIKTELEKAVLKGVKQQKIESDLNIRTVEGGAGRTDALALIGNRVFGQLGAVNLAQTDAPVNYPHLWDTPWFYWVQYNASIRLPMVRNIGEALGVGAAMNSEFESTVDVKNLHLMEHQLAGDQPFAGLTAPAWPEQLLGEIEGFQSQSGKWKLGKQLYERHCIHCHYRIEDFQSSEHLALDDKRYKRHWSEPNRFGRKYMKLPFINFVDVGTDPSAVLDFRERIVYTGSVNTDKSAMSALEALTIATSKVREREYANLGLSAAEYAAYDGYRELDPSKNSEARLEYKARPLNGIWATAPFLHNGSVANLYELLLPSSQRKSTFYVGSSEFDPIHVGFNTEPASGYFKMDTRLPGNRNTGHEFRKLSKKEIAELTSFQRERLAKNEGWAVNGRVGPELKPSERWALIEYVKSLGSPQPAHEVQPAGESAAIRQLAGVQALLQGLAALKTGNVTARGQHPKGNGVVSAVVKVEKDLDARYRVGLFEHPTEYKAVIRFSNGQNQDDNKPDVHGLAIKVLVPNKKKPEEIISQDFILADNPVFFAKNVQHLSKFMAMKLADTPLAVLAAEFPALHNYKKPMESPLESKYWSQTPYRFGDRAVKYVLLPGIQNALRVENTDDSKECKSPNFLSEVLKARLSDTSRPVTFELCIQEQTNVPKMPIEDPTVEWDSDPIKVATITIQPGPPPKEWENPSFNPWNALDQHRPMGGINRARRPIYQQSQIQRRPVQQSAESK